MKWLSNLFKREPATARTQNSGSRTDSKFDRGQYFRLGNCDFSPPAFESWTQEKVVTEMGVELRLTPNGYYSAAGECCTLIPKNDAGGWFQLAFPLEQPNLREIVVDKSYKGNFLCMADNCAEHLLVKLGFKRLGRRSDVPGYVVWRSNEVPNVYLSVHRRSDGGLAEVYYVRRDEEYEDLIPGG